MQNDLGEYFAMFNTACPGLLGSPSEFRKQFELPILAGRDAGASDKQIERVGVKQATCCSLN
jgi:DNA repair and recombination RAD54-like protein